MKQHLVTVNSTSEADVTGIIHMRKKKGGGGASNVFQSPLKTEENWRRGISRPVFFLIQPGTSKLNCKCESCDTATANSKHIDNDSHAAMGL